MLILGGRLCPFLTRLLAWPYSVLREFLQFCIHGESLFLCHLNPLASPRLLLPQALLTSAWRLLFACGNCGGICCLQKPQRTGYHKCWDYRDYLFETCEWIE